jgi:hypothetical protein
MFQKSKFHQFLLISSITGAIILSGLQLLPSRKDMNEQYLKPSSGGTKVRIEKEESEAEEHLRRLQWIEQMHKTAPGVDWREMDNQTRLKNYSNYLANKNNRSGGLVNIPGANLEGNWVEKGSINNAGRTRYADLDTSTNKLYVGSDGGNIWKGNLDGTNWEVLNDQLQFNDIQYVKVIHHNGLKRILAATWSREIYFTDDDGETWQNANGFSTLTGGSDRIERVIVSDDSIKTVYALLRETFSGSKVSLFKSIDQGSNFTRMLSFNLTGNNSLSQFDLWVAPFGDCDPFIVNKEKAYRIDRITNTANQVGTIATGISGYTMLTGHLAGNGQIYLYAYVNQLVYRSQDAGVTWQFSGDTQKDPFFKTSFSASIETPDLLFFGDIECYKSINGGISWALVNEWFDYYDNVENKLHADIPSVNSLKYQDGTPFLLINTDGGTYISNNNLNTVQNISMNGLNISQYYGSYTGIEDTNLVLIGSQDQGFQRSTTNTSGILSPEQVVSGDYGQFVSTSGGSSFWMVYPGIAIFYPDGYGELSYDYNFEGANYFWMPPLMADPDNESVAYAAIGNKIVQLDFNGSDITAQDFSVSFIGNVTSMAYSPVNSEHWYAMTDGGKFYRSSDRGMTWTSSNIGSNLDGNYLYGACILPSNNTLGEVWISGSGYSNPGVYLSTNHGANFTAKSNGLPSTMVFKLAATPAETFIFAATEVGPYVYNKYAESWFPMSEGVAPDQTYWSVEYNNQMKTARFVTYGRGIWDFRIATPLNVEDKTDKLDITLFPNPTTNYLQVHLENENWGNTTYQIFDLSGKFALSGTLKKGQKNIDLINLSDGIYIIQLKNGNKNYSRKFLKN